VAWVKANTAPGALPIVTSNYGASPVGDLSADRVYFDGGAAAGGGNSQVAQVSGAAIGSPMTFSVWMRSLIGDTTVTMFFDATTQNVVVTNQWQRFTYSRTATASTEIRIAKRDIWGSSGVADLLVWGADLRPTADTSAAIPSYQRVNTSTDYDTVGFPHYLSVDGVDDGLATGSIDLTATDKMTVWAGVHKASDAARGWVLQQEGGGGAQRIGLEAPSVALNNYVGVSGGTTNVSAAATAPAPNTSVLTVTGNIAGDLVVLRRNGVQVAQGVTDQGTGNYSNSPFYIGRNVGALQFLNGRIYSLIIRGAASSASQIAAAERYVAARTGVTL
jgi:hypothetical protein